MNQGLPGQPRVMQTPLSALLLVQELLVPQAWELVVQARVQGQAWGQVRVQIQQLAACKLIN